MGMAAVATVGAVRANASSAAASSSRVFFMVNLLAEKLGLHRENGAQKGPANTNRMSVLVLRNVTRHEKLTIYVSICYEGSGRINIE
jgi:hypothetical protein